MKIGIHFPMNAFYPFYSMVENASPFCIFSNGPIFPFTFLLPYLYERNNSYDGQQTRFRRKNQNQAGTKKLTNTTNTNKKVSVTLLLGLFLSFYIS